jgi:ADP-heptose:LPS heptosyltransferase
MADKFWFSGLLYVLFKKLLGIAENNNRDLGQPKRFIIVRQHNQLGDVLSGVSLFRAIKETYPDIHITLIVSPFNVPGMIKNRFVDRLFVFDKKKLFNPVYLLNFRNLLREKYDVAIVPVIVSISFTSNLIARLSNSAIRIGAASLNGIKNESDFFFDRRIHLDWRNHPDSNVSERSLDIVRPFGINTDNYRAEINFNGADSSYADDYIKNCCDNQKKYLIGLHVGAGKGNNRWSLEKFSVLMKKLNEAYPSNFYITGSKSDKEEIEYFKKNLEITPGFFINKPIPQVAALISKSDLFISNDTGIMHVAGTTDTPQISIFGPTNPFNWAPIGPNKYFIRKSELIDDVAVDDVYNLCTLILNQKENS